MSKEQSVLDRLMAVIEDRKLNPPPKSYTASLLTGGLSKMGQKVLEEAQEVVEAAGEKDEQGRQHLIREASDLLYHVFVLLASREVKLDEVEGEIFRRFGISGHDEKAARQPAAAKS